MSDDVISEVSSAETVNASSRHRDLQLKEACQDFEGMLTAIILKQGMNPGIAEEGETGNGVLRDFALEQTAAQMGRMGTFGIGNILYEELSGGGINK